MALPNRYWFQRKRYEPASLPMTVFLVVVVLTIVVLFPQISGVADDFQEIQKIRKKIGTLKAKAEFLENLDIAELEVRERVLNNTLPESQDLGYFLTSTRSLSRRAGVQLESVNLVGGSSQRQEEPEGVPAVARRRTARRPKEDAVSFSMSLFGTIEGLKQFLNEVEQSAPISSMGSFSFSPREEGEFFSANATLKFYYSPPPSSLGSVDKQLNVITGAEEQVYERVAELKQPETVQIPRVPTGNPRLFL